MNTKYFSTEAWLSENSEYAILSFTLSDSKYMDPLEYNCFSNKGKN